jgi:hypothetical protein
VQKAEPLNGEHFKRPKDILLNSQLGEIWGRPTRMSFSFAPKALGLTIRKTLNTEQFKPCKEIVPNSQHGESRGGATRHEFLSEIENAEH